MREPTATKDNISVGITLAVFIHIFSTLFTQLDCIILSSFIFRTPQVRSQYKSEVKFRPRTGQEGPVGGQMYSSTLPSTSAPDGGGWSAPHACRFTPRERPGTRCIGSWVGPRAGLYGCGKSRPHRDSIRGPSSP